MRSWASSRLQLHLLAVDGDERDGRAAVEQVDRGGDLVSPHAELVGDALLDGPGGLGGGRCGRGARREGAGPAYCHRSIVEAGDARPVTAGAQHHVREADAARRGLGRVVEHGLGPLRGDSVETWTGVSLPAWVYMVVALAGMSLPTWFHIELTAKVLGVALISEVTALTILSVAILGPGGARASRSGSARSWHRGTGHCHAG